MRSLPLLLAFGVLLAFAHRTIAQDNSQEQAVRKVIEEFVEAINAGDTKAFAALFTEDADFVVITGKYLKGWNEIVTYHAGLFAGSFKGSDLDVTSVAVRFLRPDVAVARVATKRTENEGKEMRTSFPMFVLTKQGKSWLITAVQNTLTSGPSIAPAGAPALVEASSSNAQGSEDELATRKVVADATKCWNCHDMICRASIFAEDADSVVISGRYFKGRDEIEKHMAASHAGIYKDSHLNDTWVGCVFCAQMLRSRVKRANSPTTRAKIKGQGFPC
jgi:uncharacterized protein (TIGR02246 family)